MRLASNTYSNEGKKWLKPAFKCSVSVILPQNLKVEACKVEAIEQQFSTNIWDEAKSKTSNNFA